MPRIPQILKVLTIGNPLLFKPAKIVTNIHTPEVQNTLDDMICTINHIGERVGLAAPQCGISQKIMIVRVPDATKGELHPRYINIFGNSKPMPWTAMINPVITPLSSEKALGWESCISVPGVQGKVSRYKKIMCKYLGSDGEEKEILAENFLARLLQHEEAHLRGVLFPMEVEPDQANLRFESEDALIKLIGTAIEYDYSGS